MRVQLALGLLFINNLNLIELFPLPKTKGFDGKHSDTISILFLGKRLLLHHRTLNSWTIYRTVVEVTQTSVNKVYKGQDFFINMHNSYSQTLTVVLHERSSNCFIDSSCVIYGNIMFVTITENELSMKFIVLQAQSRDFKSKCNTILWTLSW